MSGNPLLEPALLGKEASTPKPGKGAKVSGERMSYLPHHIQNGVVAAINIATFTDVESYKEHIDNLIDGLKALPKAEGFSEIFVPGEPEEKTFAERSRNGIPLPEGTVKNLRSISEKFGVKLPSGL
jgi:LDH2 family malate/lactate/ureidoglycolate dehydrogenase